MTTPDAHARPLRRRFIDTNPTRQAYRIVFIAGHLGLGGAERQLYYLITGLNRSRFTPLVLTLNPGNDEYWEEELRAAQIPIVEVPRRNLLRRAQQIRAIVGRKQTDLVHSFHAYVNGYAALATWGRSTIAIGGVRFANSQYLDGSGMALWRRLCLVGVDRLVCNTSQAVEMVHTFYPDLAHVQVIPNGVPIPDETTRRRRRQMAIRELEIDSEELIVGYVGRLDENKNVSLLLQAISQLASESPSFRLVIIGEGPSMNLLQAEAVQLGLQHLVSFAGSRPAAEELMPAFDVLCLPSLSEGLPNVLMEAGAAGVAVIASDVGGVREVVQDGETGLLFPSGDGTALVEHLRLLLQSSDLRWRMGRRARDWMRNSFSIEAMVSRYEQLYDELMRRN